jgi:hypothetical protein
MTGLWFVTGVSFAVGAVATGQWLPELRRGPVGFAAIFVICGLAGAALASVGIHVDLIIRALDKGGEGAYFQVSLIGEELTGLLLDSGVLAALALIAYFMAPKPQRTDSG